MSENSKKALFVLPALSSGGAERVLIKLMNSLPRNDFTPQIVAIKKQEDLGALIDTDIPYHCINTKLLILSLPGLYRFIKERDPDIVIATMAHMNFALMILRPLFPEKKFIIREAITPSYFMDKYPLGGWFIRFLYRGLYPRADLLLSPSQIILSELQTDARLRHSNTHVLPNPVDEDKIRTIKKISRPFGDDKAALYFVACGRLHPQKGFDRLIEMMARFPSDLKWHLDIIGEGEQRSKLEHLIQSKGLEERIHLKGYIAEPYSYFSAADLFLMPSRFEGLPNTVLEALASGAPVLATAASGGIAEIADSAPEGAVTIVEDMEHFYDHMLKAQPLKHKTARPSLLPARYKQEEVFATFVDHLKSVLGD